MIQLRPAVAADAAVLYPILRSVGALAADTIPPDEAAFAVALARREMLEREDCSRSFTIELAEEAIGFVRLLYDRDSGSGEISIWIAKPHQGQGWGSEVIARMLTLGFEELELDRVEAHVLRRNTLSHKAFANNGFVWTKSLPGAVDVLVAVRPRPLPVLPR